MSNVRGFHEVQVIIFINAMRLFMIYGQNKFMILTISYIYAEQ